MVEIYTGYRAFGIHAGSNVADPMDEFANVSSPESVTNGVFSVVLAMFSDLIMVCMHTSQYIMSTSELATDLPYISCVELKRPRDRCPCIPSARLMGYVLFLVLSLLPSLNHLLRTRNMVLV